MDGDRAAHGARNDVEHDTRKDRRLRIRLLGPGLVAVIASWSFLALLPTELTAFRQAQERPPVVELAFSTGLYRYATLPMRSQFSDLDRRIARFRTEAEGAQRYSDPLGRLRLPLSERFLNQANVLVVDKCIFYGLCWYVGYIELLRQSEDKLLKKFSFHKPGGYTILGRTSLPVPREPRLVPISSPVSNKLEGGLPDFSSFRRPGEAAGSISEAAAIVRYIWSRSPRLGPHDDRSPRRLDPRRRLDLLERGDWTTQCGDIRDIFVNLAAATPAIGGVRSVGLLQYHPPFPDLVPHSHAVAEVLAEDGVWVLIDPWFGLIFEHRGRGLSARDVLRMSASERKRISVTRLVPGRVSPFDAGAFQGTLPRDGYWGYFGTVMRGPNESRLLRPGPGSRKRTARPRATEGPIEGAS